MIFIRLILFAGFVYILIRVFQWLVSATSADEKCKRCNGKGYWYGSRGRERCDWCQGRGRMPKGLG